MSKYCRCKHYNPIYPDGDCRFLGACSFHEDKEAFKCILEILSLGCIFVIIFILLIIQIITELWSLISC